MRRHAAERSFRACDADDIPDNFHDNVKQGIQEGVKALGEHADDDHCADLSALGVITIDVCKCSKKDLCNTAAPGVAIHSATLVIASIVTLLPLLLLL